MTIWKDGGKYGRLCQEITDEAGDRAICKVWTRQNARRKTADGTEPWPEGEANFKLILKAPKMLEALEIIRDMAKPMLRSHLADIPATCAEWEAVRSCALAAIAATKGEVKEFIEKKGGEKK